MRLIEKSGTLQILDSIKESSVKEDVSDLVNNEDDVLLGSEDPDGVDVSGRKPIASFYVGRGNADPGIEIYEINYDTNDSILARDLAKLDEKGQAHWYTIEYEFEDEDGNELEEPRAFADVDGIKVYLDECIRTNLKEAEQAIDVFVNPERDYKITDVTMLEPVDDGDVRAIDMQSILIGLDESLSKKYGKNWGEFNIQSSRIPRGKIDESDISYVLHVLDINGHQEVLNYNTRGIGRIREAFVTNYKGELLSSKRCAVSRIPKYFMEATEAYIKKYNEEALKEDAVLPNNGYIDQTGLNLVSDERIQASLKRRVQRLKARQKLLKAKQTFGKDGNVVPVDEKNTHGKEVVDSDIGQETEPITDTKIKESAKTVNEATDEEANKMLSIQRWMEDNDFEDRWEEGAGWAEPIFDFMKKQNYRSFVSDKRNWVAYKDRDALSEFDEMVKNLNESVVTLDTDNGIVDIDGNVSHVTLDQDGTMTAVSGEEVITTTDNSVEVLPSEESMIANEPVLEPNGEDSPAEDTNTLEGPEQAPDVPENASEEEVVETGDIAMAEPVPASELEESVEEEEKEDTELWCRGKIYWAGNFKDVDENLLLGVAEQAEEEEGEPIDVDEVEIKKIEESLKESSKDIDAFWAKGFKVGDKIKSSGAGEVELLALDKNKDYIVAKRDTSYQPFVAAWAPGWYNDSELSWGQGHYFDTEEEAMEYFNTLNESLKESLDTDKKKVEPLTETVEEKSAPLKESVIDSLRISEEDLYNKLKNTPELDEYENFKFDKDFNKVYADNKKTGKRAVFKLVLTPTDGIPNLEGYKMREPDELQIGKTFLIIDNDKKKIDEAVEEKVESEIEDKDTKEEVIEEELVPSAIFHRKPSSVDSMRQEEENKVVTAKSTYVVKDVKEVDEGEFNDLCSNLLKDRDYIKEFADTVEVDNSVAFNCLEVRGPQGSLLIDPSGYGYARYCAFGEGNVIEEPVEEVEAEETIEEPAQLADNEGTEEEYSDEKKPWERY